MGLLEDVKAGIAEIMGPDSAEKIVSGFDDSKKYPKDFIEEYVFFLAKLLGEAAAKKKAAALYAKYKIKR